MEYLVEWKNTCGREHKEWRWKLEEDREKEEAKEEEIKKIEIKRRW